MPLVEYMNIFEELKSQCKLKIQGKLYSSKKKKKKKRFNSVFKAEICSQIDHTLDLNNL